MLQVTFIGRAAVVYAQNGHLFAAMELKWNNMKDILRSLFLPQDYMDQLQEQFYRATTGDIFKGPFLEFSHWRTTVFDGFFIF
jgi:hypothetical protein